MAQCRFYTRQSKGQTVCTRQAHYLLALRPAAELQRDRVPPGACWQHTWYTYRHRRMPEGTQIIEVQATGEYCPVQIAESVE